MKEYREVRTVETGHVLLFSWEALNRFAELGGFDVDLSVHKEWTKALIIGPLAMHSSICSVRGRGTS